MADAPDYFPIAATWGISRYSNRILHGFYKQSAATETIRKSHTLYHAKYYPSHAIPGKYVVP